jgi:integrase
VKRAFNWAKKVGLIPDSPFRDVELPECEKSRRPMTEEEYQTLLAAAGPKSRFGETLRFICLTGCRPCELSALQWSEVDLESAYPRLVQRKHKTSRRQRKTKLPRTIFLVREVVELLITVKAREDHPEFVFVSRRRQPWARSSLQQRLRRLRREVGLPEDVVLYCLRHKFGTDSIVRGNDIKTTGDLMGHTNTRTTEHYVDLAAHPEHLANAMIRATRSG